jgi:ATP-dependent helicase HrpA
MLPICQFKSEIMYCIAEAPATVIMAETGAGKSTRVPQFLLEAGYEVIVTQPRRLAARSVADRVANELGGQLGEIVGFKTAYEEAVSSKTQCLFCTDGLALVRELLGVQSERPRVLVIDEVHEWNLNIEVLVAWAKSRIDAGGADFKLALMSATVEADKLAAYFNDAPVISVPGRMFPVKERAVMPTLIEDVQSLVDEKRNVLVFFPGKGEIESAIDVLKEIKLEAEILPLHGELTPEDQQRCFKGYGIPKVVCSTNVAQTSVTIPDIDAVVDSGMERRIEVIGGVEGLYLRPIAIADGLQRKGRAGRCKEGIYVDRCPVAVEERLRFPKPEIQRVRLESGILRLLCAGFDMEELQFFHQPDINEIRRAKKSLFALGCIDSDGQVTPVGRQVSKMPLSPHLSRCLVEAIKLGVGEQMTIICAIAEVGGVNERRRYEWRDFINGERESDLLAQLYLYKAANEAKKADLKEMGINLRSFFRAKELVRKVRESLPPSRVVPSPNQRELILKSLCAGFVEFLYKQYGGGRLYNEHEWRELSKDSVAVGEWLIGMPFDLEIKTRRGSQMTLNLLTLCSVVKTKWIEEVAPHLVSEDAGTVYFNGQEIRESRSYVEAHN